MSELFLGVIALSVLVMAAIQVGGIVLAVRTAKRVNRFVDRVEREVEPILGSLQAVTADVARATGLVTAQLESLAAILAAFRAGAAPQGKNAKASEEDDPLFIG